VDDAALGEDDLHAAAADVDHRRGLLPQRKVPGGAPVGE
jgi:hypothetical protein